MVTYNHALKNWRAGPRVMDLSDLTIGPGPAPGSGVGLVLPLVPEGEC